MPNAYYTTEDTYKWSRDDIAIKFKGSIIGLRDIDSGEIIPIKVECLTGDDDETNIEYVNLNTGKFGCIDFHNERIVQDIEYTLGYVQGGHQAYYLFRNNEHTQKKGLNYNNVYCIPCSSGTIQFLYSRLIKNLDEATGEQRKAIVGVNRTIGLADLIPLCFKERPVIKLNQAVVMMGSGDYLSISLSPDFAIGIVPANKDYYKLFYKAHVIGDVSQNGEYSLGSQFIFLKELVEETIV